MVQISKKEIEKEMSKSVTITKDEFAKITADCMHEKNIAELFAKAPELIMLVMLFSASVAKVMFNTDSEE